MPSAAALLLAACLPACLQIWEPQLAAFEVQIVTAAAWLESEVGYYK